MKAGALASMEIGGREAGLGLWSRRVAIEGIGRERHKLLGKRVVFVSPRVRHSGIGRMAGDQQREIISTCDTAS